jgi:predicted transcriptional regulator
VVQALHAAACCLTAGDIAKRTNISEKNVATYLGRLMKSEQVTKPSRGWYMAVGLQYRERIKGVIDILKRCKKTRATNEVKAMYAPNIAPPEATYMILTAVAIKEIEAGFVDGKDCLNSLKHRGLAVFNSDTTWLIGDDWEDLPRQMQQNPFAIKMPWEV